MRKTWEKPEVVIQEFTPEEYCSSCNITADPNPQFIFTCDAGYTEENPDAIYGMVIPTADGGWRQIERFHPCGTKHYVEKDPATGQYIGIGYCWVDIDGDKYIDENATTERFLYWEGNEEQGHDHASASVRVIPSEYVARS